MILNGELGAVVREIYQQLCDGFIQQGDISSPDFVASFPYVFLPPDDEALCRRVFNAAVNGRTAEVDRSVDAFFSDSVGGDVQFYVCKAVEDFLNYAIPRTIGLPDGNAHFENLYERFDADWFGEECTITTLAVLSNVWDHSGRVVLPDNFRLRYVSKPLRKSDHYVLREHDVSFWEITRSAHPIGRGRSIDGQHHLFVLEHSRKIRKSRTLIQEAAQLSYDVARKFTFAVRLLKYSDCFSDYRGFRMLAHLSAFNMNLMNYPDSVLEASASRELSDVDHLWLRRLLPKLMEMSYANILVLDQKIEDALRRGRDATLDREMTARRVAIDRLLDYYQIFEAVLSAAGSEYASLYGAVLLKASGNGNFAHGQYETFKFLKDVFKIRNDVVHGRVDEVLNPKSGNFKLDIHRFRHIVHVLASLYVLNGPLRDAATKLALAEHVELQSIYKSTPDDVKEMRERKSSFNGW
jgi:hypothetical protein